MLSLLATLCLGFYLVKIVPKGFFPTQDIGLMFGGIQADQSISFQLMEKKLTQFVDIIRHDPAVQSVSAFTGGGQTNSGFVFVVLKPLSERGVSMQQVMSRLRPKFNEVAGARLFLQGAQDIRVGGRANNAQYQYTLQGDDANEIYEWSPKLETALQKVPLLTDVNLDQQQKGLEADLIIDRATAARFGPASSVDNLCRPKPVPRHHGGGARVLAEPRHLEPDLCQHQRRFSWRHEGDQRPCRNGPRQGAGGK
jgi:multidrug efflux pump